MGGKKSRKHYAVDERLSKDHKARVDRMLIEGATYDQVTEYVAGLGYDISRSAIGRYGRDFHQRLQDLRIVEDQSRALVAEAGDGLVLDEAVSRLLTAAVYKQMKGELDPKEIVNYMHAVANLQRSSVTREKFKHTLKQEVTKVAESVAKEAKKGGLSNQSIDKIKAEILGIPNV